MTWYSWKRAEQVSMVRAKKQVDSPALQARWNCRVEVAGVVNERAIVQRR
jgi:hypothetical protein